MKAVTPWKLVLALTLSAVMAAPVLGSRSHAADDSPIAGLKDAKIAFDITAGEPGRLQRHRRCHDDGSR